MQIDVSHLGVYVDPKSGADPNLTARVANAFKEHFDNPLGTLLDRNPEGLLTNILGVYEGRSAKDDTEAAIKELEAIFRQN